MKHHDKTKSFGRKRDQREAFMRSLASNLILNGRITTTLARAKAIRPYVEKLVTIGKKGTLASHRLIVSRLGNNKQAAKTLVDTWAKENQDRSGGYTRIIKTGHRPGDAAQTAIIEFVGK